MAGAGMQAGEKCSGTLEDPSLAIRCKEDAGQEPVVGKLALQIRELQLRVLADKDPEPGVDRLTQCRWIGISAFGHRSVASASSRSRSGLPARLRNSSSSARPPLGLRPKRAE